MNSHSKSLAYIAVATIAITLSAQSVHAGCGTCGPHKHSKKDKTPACCIAAKKAGIECKACAAKKAKKPACCIAAEKAGKECQHCKAKGK